MLSQFPNGRYRGCLPRRSRPGELCPMLADHIDVIPREEWPEWTGKITLEPFVKTILDQDGVGSCATESTTQGVMTTRAVSGLEHVLLNPWFIYHTTSGGRDIGSSIDDNLAFVREHGIAPESVWPRSKGWRTTPSEEAIEAAKEFRIDEFYEIASIEEMVSALLKGFVVVYGADGHSVLKVQHDNDQEGTDANSWGTTWGDHGFGVWVPYSKIEWQYGAFAIRTTTEATA